VWVLCSWYYPALLDSSILVAPEVHLLRRPRPMSLYKRSSIDQHPNKASLEPCTIRYAPGWTSATIPLLLPSFHGCSPLDEQRQCHSKSMIHGRWKSGNTRDWKGGEHTEWLAGRNIHHIRTSLGCTAMGDHNAKVTRSIYGRDGISIYTGLKPGPQELTSFIERKDRNIVFLHLYITG